MEQPKITVMHRINNRLRVKLSHPLRNIEKTMFSLKEREGIDIVRYNPIVKTMLVYYNSLKIDMEEVLLRIIVMYSKQYDMVPIKLESNTPTRNIPSLAKYSVLSIIIAGAVKFWGLCTNKSIQDFANWLAVGTTAGAIIEHAYNEISERGAFDPEVVSVMYLFNSVSKGNFIGASALTWITTFGRHILDFHYEGIFVRVKELKNMHTNEKYYEVGLYHKDKIYKKADFIKAFVTKFMDTQNASLKGNILISKNGMSRVMENNYRYSGTNDEIVINNI